MLASDKPRMSAVIASATGAEIHGLEIVKNSIQDHPRNIARLKDLGCYSEAMEKGENDQPRRYNAPTRSDGTPRT